MANQNSSTLYIGVTSNLVQRVYQHKNKLIDGFTARYNINKLVYYETFEDIEEAILREKQLKGGSRSKKIDLVKTANLLFKDLYEEISK